MAESQSGWSDQLAVQYAPMDATHHEFVELCAALGQADSSNFLERLDAMIAHSVEHFEQENQWMAAFDFPPAGCHVREHNTVLEILRDVRQSVIDGDLEIGMRLGEELPKWFENHVAAMDRMLAEFLSRIGYDGVPPLPAAALVESVAAD